MNQIKLNPRTRGIIFSLGVFSFLLGIFVIIGWLLKQPYLVQIHHRFSPMQFNSAIGFVLAGLGLISLFYSRFLPAVFGLLLVLLGALTLFEYAFAVNLGFDELFFKHTITVETSHAGRMGPNAALNFIFLGLGIFLASGKFNGKWAAYFISIFSLLVLFISALSLIGYFMGLPLSYGWGNYTSMSPIGTVGFLLLGTGLFLYVFKFLEKKISWFVLFIAPCFILVVSGAFLAAETEKIFLALELEKENLISRFSQYFIRKGQAMERLQYRMEEKGSGNEIAWKDYINKYFDDFPSLETIVWVDQNGGIRFIHSNQSHNKNAEFPLADLSKFKSSQERFLPYFEILKSKNGKQYIEMILPFEKLDDGYFIAIIHADKLFEVASYKFFFNKLHLIVSFKGEPLYLSSENLRTKILFPIRVGKYLIL
jgi:hypothetical protein